MNTKDLQEIDIFKNFIKFYPDLINIKSIEKRFPPEPDIFFETINGEKRTFELVQNIDLPLAMTFNPSVIEIKNLFDKYYFKLDQTEKSTFQNKFSNTVITVKYKKNIPKYKKISLIPRIFKSLMNLNLKREGILKSFLFPDIEKYIDAIFFSPNKSDDGEPSFSVDAITSFSDPILNTIKNKFNKVYNINLKIELLIYYYTQPYNKIDVNINLAKKFIINNYLNSPFSRTWIYSILDEKVFFSWPRE